MHTYKTLKVPWICYKVNVILNQQKLNLLCKIRTIVEAHAEKYDRHGGHVDT